LAVHVLLVDDQVAFRRAAARVLARMPDFHVIGEVETGEASVEAARELRPDLVLMDVHLPGIDGAEAARRILAEASAARSRLPIVFLLSTYDAADYRVQSQTCGATAYLPKAEFSAASLQAAWAAATSRPRTQMT
jgi:DNA-binding NarL/FixJ family response regulator